MTMDETAWARQDRGKELRRRARRWAARHFSWAFTSYLEGDRAEAEHELRRAAIEARIGLRRAP